MKSRVYFGVLTSVLSGMSWLGILPSQATEPGQPDTAATQGSTAILNEDINQLETSDISIGFGTGFGFGRGYGFGYPWGWGPGLGLGIGGWGNGYDGSFSYLNLGIPLRYPYTSRMPAGINPKVFPQNVPQFYTDGSNLYSSRDFYRYGGFTQVNPVTERTVAYPSQPAGPQQPTIIIWR